MTSEPSGAKLDDQHRVKPTLAEVVEVTFRPPPGEPPFNGPPGSLIRPG
jgi:hypothetical protein